MDDKTGTDADVCNVTVDDVEDAREELRILIVGKTGNGKSTAGNLILGKTVFQEGVGLSSTTCIRQEDTSILPFGPLKVIDTPDISNFPEDEAREKIEEWKKIEPHAVLVAVRCDVRYTAEEYAIYRQIKQLWGDDSLCKLLVVLFTFGDRQDRDIQKELETVCRELKELVADAGQRYVVFNKKSECSQGLIELVYEMHSSNYQTIAKVAIFWKIWNMLKILPELLQRGFSAISNYLFNA